MNTKPVTTGQLVNACVQMMSAIETKGASNCSKETQEAYSTMERFVWDATQGGDSFAVVYYP